MLFVHKLHNVYNVLCSDGKQFRIAHGEVGNIGATP
jgi:hypothetical protein